MEGMGRLRSALEFDDLPSDRNPLTGAARLIRKLAEQGIIYGPHGISIYGDQSRYILRKLQQGVEFESLPWYVRPGGFIKERCTPEERELLGELTSEDVKDVPLEWWMSEDWNDAGRGLRWKFMCVLKDERGQPVVETLPTAWKIPGSADRYGKDDGNEVCRDGRD